MAAEEHPGPAPRALTRAALERVLARAAELQAGAEGEEPASLTAEQLIELGREVGLSAEHLRQALAEERARVAPAEPSSGLAAALLGDAAVGAGRTVPGQPAAVLAGLDEWMQRNESMMVMRRFTDQLVWEPRRDFATAMRRAFRVGGREFQLSIASEVSAVVAAVDERRVHVRITAGLGGARAARAQGAIAAAVAGLLVGVPAFWMAANEGLPLLGLVALVPALVLPLSAIALARRQFRRLGARAQVAIEQALDRLEFGEARPRSAGEALFDALTGRTRLPKG